MKKLILFVLSLAMGNVIAAPVNINKADAQNISDNLQGIGMKKAEAIIKYRTEKGPFKTIDELDNVKGLGKKTIDANRKDIMLDDAPVSPAAPADKKQ